MQNTAAKRRVRWEDVDSGCLFVDAKREMPKIEAVSPAPELLVITRIQIGYCE
jgi:hypothetical protein